MGELDFNVDTVDVLAITIGGLVGLWLLPADPPYWLERIVVPCCAFGAVTAKRVFLPTAPARTDVGPLQRMGFLFLSIIGTVCTLGGFALVAFDVPELEGPGPGWPEGRLQHLLLGGGAALLTISALLDRVFLKGDAPGAGR